MNRIPCAVHRDLQRLYRDDDRGRPVLVGSVCRACAELLYPNGRPINRDSKRGAKVVEAAYALAEESIAHHDAADRQARKVERREKVTRAVGRVIPTTMRRRR